MGNGKVQMQVVGRIEVLLMADGRVVADCKAPSRTAMVMMLENAKLDLDHKLREQEQGPRVEVAPPGMVIPQA